MKKTILFNLNEDELSTLTDTKDILSDIINEIYDNGCLRGGNNHFEFEYEDTDLEQVCVLLTHLIDSTTIKIESFIGE